MQTVKFYSDANILPLNHRGYRLPEILGYFAKENRKNIAKIDMMTVLLKLKFKNTSTVVSVYTQKRHFGKLGFNTWKPKQTDFLQVTFSNEFSLNESICI